MNLDLEIPLRIIFNGGSVTCTHIGTNLDLEIPLRIIFNGRVVFNGGRVRDCRFFIIGINNEKHMEPHLLGPVCVV